MNNQSDEGGEKKVAKRTGDGDNAGVTAGMGEIVGIKWSGFTPAKGKTTSGKQHKR